MAVTLEEPGPYGLNCYRSPRPDVATDGVAMVAVNLAETDQADDVTWQAPVTCLPDA
jgi:hypothetical protein